MKKYLASIFALAIITFNNTPTQDIHNTSGQTELINFVIRAEDEIRFIKSEIDRLWHVCFEKRRYSDGVDVKVTTDTKKGTSSTSITPKYRYETVRKASCTEADVYAYKARCQDLDATITRSVDTIRYMGQSQNLYINTKDYKGYAAQNYCYTYEIYAELRRQGAEFQILPFMYFNPGTTALGITAVAIGACGVLSSVKYRSHSSFHSSYSSNYRYY